MVAAGSARLSLVARLVLPALPPAGSCSSTRLRLANFCGCGCGLVAAFAVGFACHTVALRFCRGLRFAAAGYLRLVLWFYWIMLPLPCLPCPGSLLCRRPAVGSCGLRFAVTLVGYVVTVGWICYACVLVPI